MAGNRSVTIEVKADPKGFGEQMQNLIGSFAIGATGGNIVMPTGAGGALGGAIGGQVQGVAQSLVASAADPSVTARGLWAKVERQMASAEPEMGAAVGATAGAIFGPWGTLGGAAVGAAAGYVGQYMHTRSIVERNFAKEGAESDITGMAQSLAAAGVDMADPKYEKGVWNLYGQRRRMYQRMFDVKEPVARMINQFHQLYDEQGVVRGS